METEEEIRESEEGGGRRGRNHEMIIGDEVKRIEDFGLFETVTEI